MTKAELFQRKGELTMTIEVAQAELQQVNQALVAMINEERKPKEPTDALA